MKKQEYIKPSLKVVRLQHSQHILTGSSYTNVQSTNNDDDDNPIYDSSSSADIWDDAN